MLTESVSLFHRLSFRFVRFHALDKTIAFNKNLPDFSMRFLLLARTVNRPDNRKAIIG